MVFVLHPAGQCVFASEINKHARELYTKNFHHEPEGRELSFQVAIPLCFVLNHSLRWHSSGARCPWSRFVGGWLSMSALLIFGITAGPCRWTRRRCKCKHAADGLMNWYELVGAELIFHKFVWVMPFWCETVSVDSCKNQHFCMPAPIPRSSSRQTLWANCSRSTTTSSVLLLAGECARAAAEQ